MQSQRPLNSSRLKKARVYRDLTIGQLADKVGCSRQTISTYESKSNVHPEISKIRLISKALKFPEEYFYGTDIDIKKGATYFRSWLTTSQKYRTIQTQRAMFISEIFSFLSEYIQFPVLDIPIDLQEMNPEQAAMELRRFWDLGDEPIDNIVYLVEEHGIIASEFNASEQIDAFSQWFNINGEERVLIGFSNNKTSAARIHFDVAHELGHICLHSHYEDEMMDKVEFKRKEREAHDFASAFLLPKKSFARAVAGKSTSIPHYVKLKQKWKVSIAAMIRRAYSLDLMTTEEYQNMWKTLQRRGMRKEEPLDNTLVTSMPTLLAVSVQMLLQNNIFTPEEFIEELSKAGKVSMYPEEIESLLALPEGTLSKKVVPFPLKIKSE